MKRWNIAKIILYSHDNRRREITFDLEKVNIITGESHTGKSAITEIIDYVMGSGSCYIPSFVRESCSWVGLLWIKDATQFLVCRRIPRNRAKTSEDYYFDINNRVKIPENANGIVRRINLDGILRKFEQLLGIGDIQVESHNSGNKPQEPVTARHVIPYILQDDTVIINKTILFRGGDDDQKKQATQDRIPYFLGIIDESLVQKEAYLRRLKQKLASEERKIAENERLRGQELTRAVSLLTEAEQVGLTDVIVTNLTLEDVIANLRQIVQWKPEDRVFEENNQLISLYDTEKTLEAERSRLRSQTRSAKALMNDANIFNGSAETQKRRLEVVNLFENREHVRNCPVCNQSIEEVTEPISAVHRVLERVQNELKEVERERPRLDRYIEEREDRIQTISEQINIVRTRILALVREADEVQKGLELDQRRQRIIGRISLYLETLTRSRIDLSEAELDSLKSEIGELEKEVNREAKIEQLNNKRTLISNVATDIMRKMPFEDRYRTGTVDFNPRDLSVGVITAQKREEMRLIGSDENYLTLHLAVLLALHRLFVELNRPVPGVLLLDQLSRPFYPSDVQEEIIISDEANSSVNNATKDATKLKQYFDFLFDEVARGESLQIIVLEHAYFEDDPRFVEATKERWIEGHDFLIPQDWPQLD